MVVNQQIKADLPFAKMQALGNDFVVVESSNLEKLAMLSPRLQALADLGKNSQAARKTLSEMARLICDRHFGVGADGLIVVCPATDKQSLLAWQFFNSDGSVSSMCGNGLRCLARWTHLQSKTTLRKFSIETEAGAVAVEFADNDKITCDLNQPTLESNKIPVTGNTRKQVVQELIQIERAKFVATCLSMGNPHCVIFEPAISENDFLVSAEAIQAHDFFPEGVNVEFAQVLDAGKNGKPSHVKVFVCERGCGPTLACASGAAAVCVAGVLEGRLQRETRVDMPGGTLAVSWSADDNHVRITGPANQIYSGVFDLSGSLSGSGSLNSGGKDN